MEAGKHTFYGDELFDALMSRKTVAPLTERESDITIDDAYKISLHMLQRRKAAGERVVGKKIGVTSKVVMDMLNVRQPDFGFLTDRMFCRDGGEAPASTALIQPRAEGEIAFRLKHALKGPGVTPEMVIEATESVHACFEIVDSRIKDWKIKIQDTVADNASCGMFVIGEAGVDPRKVDLVTCKMNVWKNDAPLSEGVGGAALGSPLNAVAWLANTLGPYGVTLDPGDVILSGALVPLEWVKSGDRMRVTIEGIGSASVRFV